MIPKIILVPYSGHDSDQPALDYAIQLAKNYSASIIGLHTAPDPKSIIVSYGVYGALPASPEASVRDLQKANEENLKNAESRFTKTIKDSKCERASFRHFIGNPEDIIAVQGRTADLIVMARTYENIDYMNIAENVIFGSARPVLLIPSNKGDFNSSNKILVAWNGSRESACAIFTALPYLKGKKAMILCDQEDKPFPLSAYDLKAYLDSHEIESEILTYMDQGSPLGAAILNTARMMKADMIVMGAWSHSRLRETILGGVTDFMLHNADIPVLMGH